MKRNSSTTAAQRYALVTGGSRGIGRAVCLRLAAMGIPVLINYRSNEEAARQTLAEASALVPGCELLPFDVANAEAAEAAIAQWQEAHPDAYVDVLVNNAGIRDDNLMVFMQDEQWHRVVNTTLDGFFTVTRRLLKDMLVHRHGRIVNMASLSGLKGMPGQTNYSAAKGALISATKALAQEVAARGVTANAVAPGFIATDMTADLNADELKKLVPARRFGTPDEVAALVVFLASDDAAYITGQVISINGGLYA